MSISTGRRQGVKFGFLSILASLVAAFGVNSSANASNYYIDPNYAGVNGAAYGIYTAAYNNIDAALATVGGVPAGSSAASPNYLYFAAGTYNVGITSLAYSAKNVDLVGLTGNPNDVVITSTLDASYNTGSGTIGTTGSATLQLKGNNQSASYITFANSTDTPYIVNTTHLIESPTGTFPALNGAGAANTSNSNNQAVALLLQGDEQTFNDVKVEGYQDSLYAKGGRSIFNNSYLTGDVDFVFANGTTLFNNSIINIDSDHTGGDIAAASTAKTTSNGIVFLNSTVTGNSTAGNSVTDPHNGGNVNPTAANSMYLGRPWGWTQPGGDAGTVFINTPIASVGGVSIIKPAGWLAWDTNETNPAFIPTGGAVANSNGGGNPGEDSRFAEYNSTDLATSAPENVASRISWSHQLVASQAADYTVDNIFSKSYPWYGDGYTATDTDINGAGGPAAGTGSANPSDPNYSWPAFWGDRNVNNETTAETAGLSNDPASYADPNWSVAGDWDPTNALALASVEVPEPATMTIVAGLIILPLARRPRRRLAR